MVIYYGTPLVYLCRGCFCDMTPLSTEIQSPDGLRFLFLPLAYYLPFAQTHFVQTVCSVAEAAQSKQRKPHQVCLIVLSVELAVISISLHNMSGGCSCLYQGARTARRARPLRRIWQFLRYLCVSGGGGLQLVCQQR